MAVYLDNIYYETRALYSLELLTKPESLLRPMNWVYITEDIPTIEFLHGNELIITTGIRCSESDDWLYSFINSLISYNASGIILNLGKYISRDMIDERIIKLCNKHNFPLFTMPWETMLYDVTRDYYDRIFTESQIEKTISSAFLDIILNHPTKNQALKTLNENGWNTNSSYCVAYIHLTSSNAGTDSKVTSSKNFTYDYLLSLLAHNVFSMATKFHICEQPDSCTIIFENISPSDLSLKVNDALTTYQKEITDNTLFCGIGSSVNSLEDLSKSYFHAKSTHAFTVSNTKRCSCFDELGFFRILISVNDKNLLRQYEKEKLSTIYKYDEKHQGDYLETLYNYLIFDGSIKRIAEKMYCHRNTINYKVRIIRDELGYDLGNSEKRFELMTAFEIRNYLKLIEE